MKAFLEERRRFVDENGFGRAVQLDAASIGIGLALCWLGAQL